MSGDATRDRIAAKAVTLARLFADRAKPVLEPLGALSSITCSPPKADRTVGGCYEQRRIGWTVARRYPR